MTASARVMSGASAGFEPQKIASALRRLTLPVAVIAGIVFWQMYAVIRVPAGMDTMPHIAPSSVCLVARSGKTAKVGHEVFCEVPDGGTVLSRVQEVTADDRLVLRHDYAASRLPDSRVFGPVMRDAVRGVVLVVFGADAEAEIPRDR